MSTLQTTPQHRDRNRGRLGTTVLALGTLVAIGLALLILMPTSHRTTAPTAGNVAQPLSNAATAVPVTAAPPGCFHNPHTHAVLCPQGQHAAATTSTPTGYFRDPATHKLLRIPSAHKPAADLPPSHSRGRIVP